MSSVAGESLAEHNPQERLMMFDSLSPTTKQTILRCVFASTFLIPLAGCMGLEVANAVVQVTNTAVSDLVSAQRMTVVSNELNSATPAIYRPYAYRSGQDCVFSAFVVPYERTWPEEVRYGEEVRVLLPEPGKIAGYASVIYKKVCPGVAPRPILRAGRQATTTGTGTIFTRAFSSDKTTYFMNSWDNALNSQDMTAPDQAVPQWWPQVVARMIQLSKTDLKVKTVLVEEQELFMKSVPDQADALRAISE